MDLNDFFKDIQGEPNYVIERRLNDLVRKNYHYRNLNEKNKKIVLDLVLKYKEKIRTGIGISDYSIRRDLYNLHRNRLKTGLTLIDLKDIKQFTESFKK
ncbi:hypothetical protein CVU83_00645 [Candidatus Falkowbacteria bacterium HGW-Falkowbacteria-2]|jgi:hypothetical protein|uniref:Uncharacterized protein n=1 Tax=Candidatus Falkowbacteria bacterium HGW-Falkowbacteria-2 TaxID=2013769 RepID=A0A2N2E348_9BACT|nr:MAG: hypothetical protein CVU83_00645 [Candidatus Falkowbacteria bacterium HGW-Falkowbacteria-2]